jgi:hypothetical protein
MREPTSMKPCPQCAGTGHRTCPLCGWLGGRNTSVLRSRPGAAARGSGNGPLHLHGRSQNLYGLWRFGLEAVFGVGAPGVIRLFTLRQCTSIRPLAFRIRAPCADRDDLVWERRATPRAAHPSGLREQSARLPGQDDKPTPGRCGDSPSPRESRGKSAS